MICPQIPNLLRRTSAALAAIAGLMIAADSQAAQISLSSGTSSCTYQGISVTPSGDFTVSCTGTVVTAGAGGTFALSAASVSLQVSTAAPTSLYVTRTGGTTDAVTVAYTITGNCTAVAAGTATFANGASASVAIPITASATAGSCTVTLTGITDTTSPNTASPLPALAAPMTANVNVTAAPPPGSCPTPPADMVTRADSGATDFQVQGTLTTVTMQSRQIMSLPLPDGTPLGGNSGKMKIGETTGTAGGSYLEVAISKCPGVIDPNGPTGCYWATYVQNYSELLWFYKLGSFTPATLQLFNWCYAPKLDATGAPQQWYVNSRWTYPFSAWGFGRYVFTYGSAGY